jgi:ATP-dependent DNA helicase RecG
VEPDIAAALQSESERVEWKESAKDASAMLRAVCAVANDLGGSRKAGYVLLGVDDSGRVVGEDTSDEAIQRITSRLHSTKILPHPSCSISVETSASNSFLAIRIEPYEVPPIVKVDGVPWVRVGTTTRRASDSDRHRLEERRPEARLPFDLRTLRTVPVSDLNVSRLRAEWVADRDDAPGPDTFPDFERWLEQREIIRTTPDGLRATVVGTLFHGIDLQSALPGAVVEFARYDGPDFDADVFRRKTITGTVTDQLDALWAQFEANVTDVLVSSADIKTQYAPDYPLEVLKELARNLVQHRDYAAVNAPSRVSWFTDKVVFNNPGGPYGQANEGTFGDHSDYRNPTLTRHLAELGYVERLGRGIRRVRRILAANGNPELTVETDGFTTITVRPRS